MATAKVATSSSVAFGSEGFSGAFGAKGSSGAFGAEGSGASPSLYPNPCLLLRRAFRQLDVLKDSTNSARVHKVNTTIAFPCSQQAHCSHPDTALSGERWRPSTPNRKIRMRKPTLCQWRCELTSSALPAMQHCICHHLRCIAQATPTANTPLTTSWFLRSLCGGWAEAPAEAPAEARGKNTPERRTGI